ncbi:MAG: hypothetical protein SGI88_09000, partial [Candidatus Hydrogenedentes bacterium]|nr:hypothetical protein [Candidatus Hydrogenedentota bacterium]
MLLRRERLVKSLPQSTIYLNVPNVGCAQGNRVYLRSDFGQEMESGSYPLPHSKALRADFRRQLAARSALDCG